MNVHTHRVCGDMPQNQYIFHWMSTILVSSMWERNTRITESKIYGNIMNQWRRTGTERCSDESTWNGITPNDGWISLCQVLLRYCKKVLPPTYHITLLPYQPQCTVIASTSTRFITLYPVTTLLLPLLHIFCHTCAHVHDNSDASWVTAKTSRSYKNYFHTSPHRILCLHQTDPTIVDYDVPPSAGWLVPKMGNSDATE